MGGVSGTCGEVWSLYIVSFTSKRSAMTEESFCVVHTLLKSYFPGNCDFVLKLLVTFHQP
jgi:hypothetical protein